jgi:dCTP deaminase
MIQEKKKSWGVSYGMSEAGYDIRIAEDIMFFPEEQKRWKFWSPRPHIIRYGKNTEWPDPTIHGRFCLASTLEEFQMPSNLTGIVHDKSTWARRGLSVYNTVIEPGWAGFLTLELSFSGEEPLTIPAGAGIAQVIFHQTAEQAVYDGKYQNAKAGPQKAILE